MKIIYKNTNRDHVKYIISLIKKFDQAAIHILCEIINFNPTVS